MNPLRLRPLRVLNDDDIERVVHTARAEHNGAQNEQDGGLKRCKSLSNVASIKSKPPRHTASILSVSTNEAEPMD